MKTFLILVEFFTALALIIAILLHQPKGEGLGGIGGQARMFNYQKDLESGLNRVTGILAIVFIVVAVILSILPN